MKESLFRQMLRRFNNGAKSGVDQDYLRRWSKKPIQDKFLWLQEAWKFGEESKKIHARNQAREAAKKAYPSKSKKK